MAPSDIRHSQSADPFFKTKSGRNLLSEQYQRNLGLYDFLVAAVAGAMDDPRLYLRASTVLEMHRIAFDGLSSHAGLYRVAGVTITLSPHRPPDPVEVPVLIEGMIEYLRTNWVRLSPAGLAAYALWRLLWIHPFLDGNGVVARAFSYGLACLRSGSILTGSPTLPEQIAADRAGYYDALGHADQRWQQGTLDISRLEKFVESALARQLADVS